MDKVQLIREASCILPCGSATWENFFIYLFLSVFISVFINLNTQVVESFGHEIENVVVGSL